MIFDFNELEFRTAHLAKKTEVLHRLEEKLDELCQLSGQPRNQEFEEMITKIYLDIDLKNQWSVFEIEFNKNYNNFLCRFMEKHPSINKSALLLCAMIRMKKSAKEIASLINTSVTDVDARINRLQNLLISGNSISLVPYIIAF